MSAYLLGNIIFILAWIVLFWISKRTRQIQLFGSLLLLPFGILDIWFRPEYWHPPLLIKAIEPLSLETAIYCFTAGGIAVVFGQLFLNQKVVQLDRRKIGLFFVVSFGLFSIFQGFKIFSAMNNLNLAFLPIWFFLLFINFRRNWRSLIPGLLFGVFTIFAINFALLFFPDFVMQYWNLPELWPTFLNTPSEEILFAGILGALWSLLPEYFESKNTNLDRK